MINSLLNMPLVKIWIAQGNFALKVLPKALPWAIPAGIGGTVQIIRKFPY